MKQERRAQKFIFASLMDICHLKNAELEAKHQKYKGRVVLRGDIVKDDLGLTQYPSTENLCRINSGKKKTVAA